MSDDYTDSRMHKTTEIWIARLTQIQQYRAGLLKLLSASEEMRCQRYRQQNDRDRFLGGRAMAKLAAAQFCQCPVVDISIEVVASGKPVLTLAQANLIAPKISISHAGELVVFAIAYEGDLGVDVELLHRDVNIADLARVVCSDSEIAAIERTDEKTAVQKFYEFWVLKEAYLKATGEGLSADARALIFSVDTNDSGVRLLQDLKNQQEQDWKFFLTQYDQQHMLALATKLHKNTDSPGNTAPHIIDAQALLQAC